jgi:hypothetical protein
MGQTDRVKGLDRAGAPLPPGPADDLAEPNPSVPAVRITLRRCAVCDGAITKNRAGRWEHITLTGEVCD